MLGEVLHGANRWIGRRQQVWIDRHQRAGVHRETCTRCGKIGRTGRKLALADVSTDAGIYQRVINSRIDHATVVNSPAAANTRLTIAGQIVSKADAWSKVVPVIDFVIRLRQRRIRIHRIRIALVFVTQTEVQRESRRHAPVVLKEVVEIGGLHVQTQNTEALVEVARITLTNSPGRTNAQSKRTARSI